MTLKEPTLPPLHLVRPRLRKLPVARPLPPLENGDRLTRREFERRYQARPDLKKAELIEGVVYMPSPVHFQAHSEPHAVVITWLGVYLSATPGLRLGDNATVRLDADNEVQPDALLRLKPAQGGKSRLGDDDFVEGAPELVVEVAASSASTDLHDKLKVYRRNGVLEYLVWQSYDQRVDWFSLQEGEYLPLAAGEDGVIRSRVFPGLWLATQALLEGDLAALLAELQKGLASEEHAAFARKLAETGA
ncbi:MAG: Uma2 family endonuclease [Chloroflexi bacterium]|nr:Uma2 family endonuclease [Chloroflexota bacterium]